MAEARRTGAEVVVPPTRPVEMRESVEIALETLSQGTAPDRVLLLPGDSPGIQPDLIANLLQHAKHPNESSSRVFKVDAAIPLFCPGRSPSSVALCPPVLESMR